MSTTPLGQVQEAIKQTGPVEEIVELNLSQISIVKFTPEIKSAIEKCKNLEILILTQCDLESLDNMPETDLTAIDLTANKYFFIQTNRLTDAELVKLAKYKNLGQLILNQNSIQKVQSLKVLDKLQHLQEIDLSDNPITKVENYRDEVYKTLQKLEILDRFDRDGNEQLEEEDFEDDEDDDEEDFDDDEDEDEDEDGEDFDEDEEEESPKPKKKR